MRNPWCVTGARDSSAEVVVSCGPLLRDRLDTNDLICVAKRMGVSVSERGSFRESSGGKSRNIDTGARIVDCKAEGSDALYLAKFG